ncbi:hypothetical protein BH10PSE7_BH10PSE7_27460 [soil metagenome]
MKVTLDITRLLSEGKITQAEFNRLSLLSEAGTGSLAFNILVGFGVVAVSAGLIALVPNEVTGIIVGGGILAAGIGLIVAGLKQWSVLAQICVLIGALMLGGGIVMLSDASVPAFLGITFAYGALGVLAGSGLLVALSVLALSSAIGARTGYEHATYFLGIEEPAITVVLFTVVAIALYLVSKRLTHPYERLAIIASRTALLLVNFGFWIGSLWGDTVQGREIPDMVFIVGWALALLGAGYWAAQANRPWVLNAAAVFGAIHFYTQFFERLGPNPAAILVGGLIALGLAFAFWKLNQHRLA